MTATELKRSSMTTTNSPADETAERELVITRIFDAPRELVWKAWTDPEMFMKWWGPKDFTSPGGYNSTMTRVK